MHNEEAKAEDQIPLKIRAKKGYYRLKSKKKFKQEIYVRRNNVELVYSVIKRKFNGINRSRNLKLSNKETKLKNVIYNIYQSIQIQLNEDFYKAIKIEKRKTLFFSKSRKLYFLTLSKQKMLILIFVH